MQEVIKNLAVKLFQNPIIATIFVSMFPVIEVKGAIPFGQSKQIWGNEALSLVFSLICALIGGLIISALILLVLKLTFSFFNKNKKFSSLVERIKSKSSNKINKVLKTTPFKTYLYLFLFVAIPLPLTGIWSGCLIAALLNLDYFKSLIAITLGNAVAGTIIALLSLIAKDVSIYIFYFFAIFLFLTIIYYLTKIIVTNLKARKISN